MLCNAMSACFLERGKTDYKMVYCTLYLR